MANIGKPYSPLLEVATTYGDCEMLEMLKSIQLQLFVKLVFVEAFPHYLGGLLARRLGPITCNLVDIAEPSSEAIRGACAAVIRSE